MPRYIDAERFEQRIIASPAFPNMGQDGFFLREMVLNILDGQPAADVAPKSEVEKIIYKLECLLCHATGSKLSKYTYDLRTMETAVTDYINESYDEGYRDAKSEVAREIFADIDNMLADFVSLFHDNISKATIEQDKDKQQVNSVALSVINTARTCFAELKKKYDVTDTNVGNKCAEGDK